jgi:hypothetical protein
MFAKENHGAGSSMENPKRKSQRAQALNHLPSGNVTEFNLDYSDKYQFYPRTYAETAYMMDTISKPSSQGLKDVNKVQRRTREGNNENYNPNERKSHVRNPFLQAEHHPSASSIINRSSAAALVRGKPETKELGSRSDKLYQISSKFQADELEEDKASVMIQITTKKLVKSKTLKRKDASKTKIKIDKKIKVGLFFFLCLKFLDLESFFLINLLQFLTKLLLFLYMYIITPL